MTLRANRAAFEAVQLLPRVLVDVSRRDLTLELLGSRLAFPVLVAPTAFHRLAHPEGELATARAAGAAGTLMVLSTLATTSAEDVARAASGPLWFQLYVYRDKGATRALVERVEAAGYRALVVTVDAPLLGRRERDIKNRFQLPHGLGVENLFPAGMKELPREALGSGLAAYFVSLLDHAFTWNDLEWLRGTTRLPVILKGIHRPDDARRAVEHGMAGIVVSNHGARQLDGVPASIELLPPIAEAVAGRLPVLLDGGIRRGTDVLKALALGARAVLLGRPVLWGLAVGGEAGARRVLELLRGELDHAMALAGCASLAGVTPDLVRQAPAR